MKFKEFLNESEKAQHGFDLTDIPAKDWKKLVDKFALKVSKKDDRFEWKGKDILVVTKNNPITGKYGSKGKREDEKDYTSYIGIEGKKELVKKIASFINKYGSPKDESKGTREYI